MPLTPLSPDLLERFQALCKGRDVRLTMEAGKVDIELNGPGQPGLAVSAGDVVEAVVAMLNLAEARMQDQGPDDPGAAGPAEWAAQNRGAADGTPRAAGEPALVRLNPE